MKTPFLAFLLMTMAFGLQAQKNQGPAQGTVKQGCGTHTVIDITGLKGTVESQLWDPRPADARKNTSKVTYEVLNNAGKLVQGWKQCDIKKCGTVSWLDHEGKKQVQARVFADKKTATAVAQHAHDHPAQVLDLTSFGPGTYTIRAKAGDQVCETTVIIPQNGLSIPKPHDRHMEDKSGK